MADETLYHWTAPTTTHLGSILDEGQIRTTESNLSLPPEPPHAGPPVVWLTDLGGRLQRNHRVPFPP